MLKRLYYSLLKHLPTKPALYLMFFRGYKKRLNLKNPLYFGEKIQWLKMYGNLEALSKYVDKYEVRGFVKRSIGEQHLIPLLGVYDTVESIDFKSLPNQFVLKSTNGCHNVIVVKNKKNINLQLIKNK